VDGRDKPGHDADGDLAFYDNSKSSQQSLSNLRRDPVGDRQPEPRQIENNAPVHRRAREKNGFGTRCSMPTPATIPPTGNGSPEPIIEHRPGRERAQSLRQDPREMSTTWHPLYTSVNPAIVAALTTLGDDMDDEKPVLEQMTDAMSSAAEATKETAKTAVKKVRKATKRVAKKVTPKKKAAKKSKTAKKAGKKSAAKKSAKKSAKKAVKKTAKKKKKAKKSKR